MSGYVHYDDLSPLSPLYPRTISVGENIYNSAANAIQAGENPSEVMLLLVRNNRNLYYPYRNYEFRGTYSDLLNRAISLLLIPRRERIGEGRFLFILTGDLRDRAQSFPREYSLPVIRNVYRSTHVEGNIYQEVEPLDVVEQYSVYLVQNVPLYVGSMGAFFLLEDRYQSIPSLIPNVSE